MRKVLLCLLLFLPVVSQGKNPKAWEFGLGGSAFQFNRTRVSITETETGNLVNVHLKNTLYTGNIYVAKELSRSWYLAADVDFRKDMIMPHLNVQWRFCNSFSDYIEPYVGVGVSYLHKSFDNSYLPPISINNRNNAALINRNNMAGFNAIAGVNMWLNDRIGIGLSGQTYIMPYRGTYSILPAGTVKVMVRFGGRTKKTVNYVKEIETVYRDREVEKIVEKYIEVPPITERFMYLAGSINFDFDDDLIKDEYVGILADLARLIKDNPDKRYLFIGATDAKGSTEYNEGLSLRRATSIVNKLIELGVDPSLVKARGVGKRISFIRPDSPNEIRRGDRKVMIEIIDNIEYFNQL